MIKNKTMPTLRFCLIQGLFWGSFGCVFAFSSVYLLAKGFTNSQVGYILSAGSAVSVIMQPLVGSFVDKSRKMLLRSIPVILSAIVIGFCTLLLLIGEGMLLRAVCYGTLVAVLQILMPLLYSLGIHYMEKGVNINFGIGRGTGSTAYALVTTFLGVLVGKAGENTVIVSVIVIYLFMIAAVLSFRFGDADGTAERMGDQKNGEAVATAKSDPASGEQGRSGSTPLLAFFAKNRRFTLVLLGCVLAFTSHNIVTNYLFQIVSFHGYGSKEMGYGLSITALSELPALFCLSFIMKKIRVSTLFRLSVAVMFVKNLFIYLATGIVMLYLAMGFQLLGYGLFAGISVYYVNMTVTEKDRTKGQALMTATSAAGAVAGCLLGGVLLDVLDVKGMLLVSTVIALCGALTVYFSAKKTKAAA